MTAPIYLTSGDPVGELVLDRPGKRNALSIAMWAEIPRLIAQAEQDTDIKVLLLHGGLSGSFAAGADISEFSDIYDTRDRAREAGAIIARALAALEACRKPILSAIEGACVGGGVSLALATDYRIAADTARLGITPARLGLVYPPSDTRRLIAALGESRAKELLFTGRLLPADEAHGLGLIDRVAADGTARQVAHALALQIAENSQWSVRAIKDMIRGLSSGWADDATAATDLFLDGFEQPDFREGEAAFLEKRRPDFKFR
ncbi:MAG: enoyl-CoA hydratase/isomerase family protein [Henriciella sp.]|jgi:enoyl-CoA hydratase/carnithine racemase